MARPDTIAAITEKKILFVSCNEVGWGGSEELWAQTAQVLARQGHRVSVAKPNLLRRQQVLDRLRRLGCAMTDLAKFPLLPKRVFGLMARISRQANLAMQLTLLWVRLLRRPDLVVLNQAGNWDGFLYAQVLRRRRCRYVVIAQKATELYWPSDWMRPACRSLYSGASAAYFVSGHNHRLTEEQLGMSIEATVVRNPFLNDWATTLPWPADDGTLRFACVGRFYPMEKGQDTLLRVLGSAKWRSRPVAVSFYGAGDRVQGLRELAEWLGVCASFPGFVDDIRTIWADHHALALPTRAEGLPLVVVEAMLAGRVVVTTDVGGSAEVCRDGETGFIAASPDEHQIDAALERAWQRRDEWPQIGAAAAIAIRKLVPPDPAATFAALLLTELSDQSVTATQAGAARYASA